MSDHPFQDAVKGVIGNFLRSQSPQSQTGTEPVVITPSGVLGQLQRAIDHGTDRDEPIRLALLLAAILASQRGWKLKDALTQAGIAWAQTEGLRNL
jgi:hypothetical protein